MQYYGVNLNTFVNAIYSTPVAKRIKHLLSNVLDKIAP